MDSLIDYISNLTITQGAATGEAGSSRSFRPKARAVRAKRTPKTRGTMRSSPAFAPSPPGFEHAHGPAPQTAARDLDNTLSHHTGLVTQWRANAEELLDEHEELTATRRYFASGQPAPRPTPHSRPLRQADPRGRRRPRHAHPSRPALLPLKPGTAQPRLPHA